MSGQTARRVTRTLIVQLGRRVRTAMLRFRLPGAAVVEFAVVQVAPRCRTVGAFRVRAHRGINRVRFRTRLDGRRLGPGTYRVIPRVVRGAQPARPLGATTVVLTKRVLSPAQIRAARLANACPRAQTLRAPVALSIAAGLLQPIPWGNGTNPPAAESSSGAPTTSGVRGVALGLQPGGGGTDVAGLPLYVVALLGLAICLLAVGSAPQRLAVRAPRVTALVTVRRLEIVMAGGLALFAAALVYLLA